MPIIATKSNGGNFAPKNLKEIDYTKNYDYISEK